MKKQIANVVFYKFYGEQGVMQQACIFYADGTVQNVPYEDGIDAAHELAVEQKIKTKAEFTNKVLNKQSIYTLSGTEFERRFKEFLGKGVTTTASTPVVTPTLPVGTSTMPRVTPTLPVATPTSPSVMPTTPAATATMPYVTPTAPVPTSTMPRVTPTAPVPTPSRLGVTPTPVVVPTMPRVTPTAPIITPTPTRPRVTPTAPIITPTPTRVVPTAPVPTPTVPGKGSKKSKKKNRNKNKNKNKKQGLFSRLWAKVTAVVLAIALAFTGGFCLGRNTKSGQIINNNINQNQTMDENDQLNAAYLNLLNKCTNEDQKAAMKLQGESLDSFNKDFAAAHKEAGKDIKAALTWDEMMALNVAYNSYSKDQIRAMFNGSEVDSKAMSDNYKNATLQLMGAYVISTRENPVNSSQFLVNEDERAFVEKYNDLFLNCKEATGDARVAAINAFYAELYKDFPISDEVREEGISHADGRKELKPYKAAITPMVAATEIMFQNTSGVDHTLSDKAIAYFNDLGLCNLVDGQFERAETITLTSTTDDKQPTYEEFRNAKIMALIYAGNYPTDDAHRDLSQLDEFQKWVNGHFLIVDGINTGKVEPNVTTTTTTYTETKSRTETTTEVTSDRNEAVNQVGEDAVRAAEEAVDQQLEAANAAAKAEAEREAERRRQELQAEADREKERLEAEVAADQQDLQENIAAANEGSGPISEDDIGHGAEFDDGYTDGNGDLGDYVEDVTTDGDGAVSEGEPLPDPNQTGAEFDGESVVGYNSSQAQTGTYGMSNEDLVNAYIRELEAQGAANQDIQEYEEPYTSDGGYQYHK